MGSSTTWWSEVSTPVPADIAFAVAYAVGFIGLRYMLNVLIYKPLAYRFLRKGSVSVIDEARQSKIMKSSESMWKLTYYVAVQLWVLLIIQHEPWSMNTMEYFEGWPNQKLTFSLKHFYMCQCGFYIYSIAALLAWETRRKDFSIMMSHHVITSILIGYSYLTRLLGVARTLGPILLSASFSFRYETDRFFRIGTIILALHDLSDVFLEAAKVFKYSEKETGASLGFGLFAVSWLLSRLIFFPFFIIKSSSYHSIDSLKKVDSFPTALYYIFNTMLLTLLVFHVYWWKLICAMIMRQMNNRGKVGEDIRSDSEDGD